MNRSEMLAAMAMNRAVSQIIATRMDGLAMSLASLEASSARTGRALDAFVLANLTLLRSADWPSKLVFGEKKAQGVVWVLIAPDYAGVDRNVMDYQGLFFERSRQAIAAQSDIVICVGASARALAAHADFKVAHSESCEYANQADRAQAASFLAQLAMNLATGQGYGGVRLLHLGPRQKVLHTVLPLAEHDIFGPALKRAPLSRIAPPQGTASLLADMALVFLAMEINMAMTGAEILLQTALYQGMQAAMKRTAQDQSRLSWNLRMLKERNEQEGATPGIFQRKAVA